MGRYFVAVVPAGLGENPEFNRLMGKLKRTVKNREVTVRWTPPAMYHVTLEFLGDLDDVKRDAVIHTIQEAPLVCEELELEIAGMGAFPEPESARVLWLGVARTQALVNLHSQLRKILRGFRSDSAEEDFVPHLTIARFRNPISCIDLLELAGRKKFGKYAIVEIVVFESVIENHMAKYIPIFRRPSDSGRVRKE